MTLTAIQKIEKLGRKVTSMTQAELARAVGVSRERIRQLMPRLKFKPSRRVRAWHSTVSKNTAEAMAKLHDEGESLAAIASRYGISEYHVREVIRKIRSEIAPAGRIQRLRRQEAIRRLIEQGMTFEQACDKLGLSNLQRRRYRRQMGYRWSGSRTIVPTREESQ
ncbi:MAG: sigma factor-like helix-turn-helix DNA-binding protein [candidate division WOR-3 bacterium]